MSHSDRQTLFVPVDVTFRQADLVIDGLPQLGLHSAELSSSSWGQATVYRVEYLRSQPDYNQQTCPVAQGNMHTTYATYNHKLNYFIFVLHHKNYVHCENNIRRNTWLE